MIEVEQRLPRIGGDILITYSDRTGKKEEHLLHDGQVPKELMDAYQQIIGDSKARVAVGADFAVKDFGTGAGASVTVSLSCNQDAQTINQAITLAATLAQQAAAHYQAQGAEQAKALETSQRGGPRSGGPDFR